MEDSKEILKKSSTKRELCGSINEQDVEPTKWTAEHEGYIEHNNDTLIIPAGSTFACNTSEDVDDSASKKEVELRNLTVNIKNNFGTIVVGRNTHLNFMSTNNAIQGMKLAKEDQEDDAVNLKQLTFNSELLHASQSKVNAYNRSEFCHGQVVVTSTQECGSRSPNIKVYTAKEQLVHIENNFGIIIVVYDSNSFKDASAQDTGMSYNLNVANNHGYIQLGNNTQLNVEQPREQLVAIQETF